VAFLQVAENATHFPEQKEKTAMHDQIRWTQSTGMVGGTTATVLGAILSAAGATASGLLMFGAELPREVVIGATVALVVVGALGSSLGIYVQRWRREKGESPLHTEPAIAPRSGSSTGIGVGVLAVAAVGAAILFSASCAPARLAPTETPRHVEFGLSVSCAAATYAAEQTRSPGLSLWVQRVCVELGVSEVGGIIASWFSEPSLRPLSLTSRPGIHATKEPDRVVLLYAGAGEEPVAVPCSLLLEACAATGGCSDVLEACAAR
jgi:hypothetical protein